MAESDLQTPALSPRQVNQIRVAGQYLRTRGNRDELMTVVKAVYGINAQLSPAMMLSLRARIEGLELEDVKEALEDRQDIVRTWAMRGALHLLASSDIHWFISTLGPALIAKGKRRYRELGLTENILERGLSEIPNILAETSPLTRWELMDALAERGVSIDTKSQAPIHLIRYVALHGSICLGPDRPNREATYTVLKHPPRGSGAVKSEPDLATLAKRYIGGYGPADFRDFAAWSGAGLTDSKNAWKALEDEDYLMPVRVMEKKMMLSKTSYEEAIWPTHEEQTARLLPAFDSYVLGYSNREFIVTSEHYRDIYHGGQTVPVVVVNGRAEGIWRYERTGQRMSIEIRPFSSFSPTARDLVLEEAEDIGRFFRVSLSTNIE